MSPERPSPILTVGLRAWRGITYRQWKSTTAVALLLFLGHVAGVLPAVLYAPDPINRTEIGWNLVKFTSLMLTYLVAAYSLLLTVSIAEHGAGSRPVPAGRYIAAGLSACGAMIVAALALYRLVPALGMQPFGLPLALDTTQLLYSIVWLAANYGLVGGLALAVHVRFRSARIAREAFNAAEMERANASRELLAPGHEASRS